MIPGEYLLGENPIEGNKGKATTLISVTNTGDRPVQVGSHFHFFEVNRQLDFDRVKAYGMRLHIAAGTAVRFEPGEAKEVLLVPFGGERQVHGFNNLVKGETETGNGHALLKKLNELQFKHTEA